MPAPGRDPWEGLSHDPRLPEHAHLRAAHRDREAVAQVLAEAYADGRLTAEEHEERSGALLSTKTLGELPALVSDLVWTAPPQPWASPGARLQGVGTPQTSAEIRAKAEASYVRERAGALWTMLSVTTICVVIWLVGSWDSAENELDPYFPWPLLVLLGTGFHYAQVVYERRQRIEEEVARLGRKAAKKELRERKRRGELPGG